MDTVSTPAWQTTLTQPEYADLVLWLDWPLSKTFTPRYMGVQDTQRGRVALEHLHRALAAQGYSVEYDPDADVLDDYAIPYVTLRKGCDPDKWEKQV